MQRKQRRRRRQHLRSWLDFNDVQWSNCKVKAIPGRGNGVFASSAVTPGSVLLSVPDEAVLMSDDCCVAVVSQIRWIIHRSDGSRLAQVSMAFGRSCIRNDIWTQVENMTRISCCTDMHAYRYGDQIITCMATVCCKGFVQYLLGFLGYLGSQHDGHLVNS